MRHLSFIKYAVLLLATIAIPSFAAIGDEDFLLARAAYNQKNAIALSEYAHQLQHQQHILAPYADYWLMLLSLREADNQTVVDFINAYSAYPFADKLRGEYLKKLGKEQDWTAFVAEFPNYAQEDAAVACYAAEANAVFGDATVLVTAKSLWLQAKEQPSNCNNLYDRMQAANVLSEEDIWTRFRLAVTDNRMTIAKGILKRSKSFESSQLKLIDKVAASPGEVLAKKTVSLNTRLGRELNLMALNRVAKTSSLQALSLFNRIEDNMLANDKKVFYGRLALYAAQRHEPQALDWFKLATDTVDFSTVNSSALKYSTPNNKVLDKDQLAWYARAALRDKNWPVVADVISKMDTSQAQEGAWRYWKARALKVQKQTLEANTLFAKLSTERHFYGWLAQDELEGFITAPPVTHKTTEEAVQAFADIPAIQRAVALHRLDFKWEAKAEWVFASQAFNDSQLLAAAEFAHRKNWYDLAIVTADKTSEIHDFALRYPTPYRIAMKSAASEQSIDEAWVYGITRQESRFMYYAKSGVGASGLMQLMPATAKWIAGKAGIEDYHHGMIHELDTNIDIGTYYLRYTLDLMNGQAVMATAAYNAGASRAKKWMADEPLEGAIYAETIPFSETRNYVQKVMANAHIYAHQLGLKSITLKQRLGTIPGKAVAVIPAINSDNIDLKSAILINDEQ